MNRGEPLPVSQEEVRLHKLDLPWLQDLPVYPPSEGLCNNGADGRPRLGGDGSPCVGPRQPSDMNVEKSI